MWKIPNLFFISITLLLSFLALLFSVEIYFPLDRSTAAFSPLYNILAFLTFLLFFIVFIKTKDRLSYKNIKTIGIFASLMIVLSLFLADPSPYNDQGVIYQAVNNFWNNGIDSVFDRLYFSAWTHQVYTLFLMLPFKNYYLFYGINLICYIVVYYSFLYLINRIYKDEDVNKWAVFVLTFFYPLGGFVLFYYGELISLTMLFLAMVALIYPFRHKYLKGALLGLILAVSALYRENALIMIVAIILCSIFIKGFILNGKNCLLMLLILSMVMGGFKLAVGIYCDQKGFDLAEQSNTKLPWITMGMMDNDKKGFENQSGSYNDYVIDVLKENDFDDKEINRDCLEVIGNRLAEFIGDPMDALAFYANKIALSWLAPDFGMYSSTGSLSDRGFTFFYSECVRGFGLFVLKGFYMAGMIGLLWRGINIFKKRSFNYVEILIMTYFVGGFLFSLIWEAKSRYNLPYFTVGLLLVPFAFNCFSKNKRFKRLLKRIK